MEETAAVPNPPLKSGDLRPYLEACGYTGSRLTSEYPFNGSTASLVGFYSQPWDTRTACIAVVDEPRDSLRAAARCMPIGAPTVFVCQPSSVDVWRLTPAGPSGLRSLSAADVPSFFDEHQADLSPKAIHDAKMRRPIVRLRQMQFVDLGLMSAVERQAGETLHRLVEGAIQELAEALGEKLARSKTGYEKLYKTVFWLLAAKLLHEKHVSNFIRIDLTDVDQVFDRVAKHYGSTDNLPPGGKRWRPAIDHVARNIAAWGHLGHVSTEALGYLYEKALIDKRPRTRAARHGADRKDIRKELGIHSTPPVLVDHMLAQLWPMIEEIAPEHRSVFEPACGHAAFLVASLRWLRDYASIDEGPELHQYLRRRLHGIEVDPFARELAKLSLTLADVPHGNTWQVDQRDMFEPQVLQNAAARSSILLANPPYESFSNQQKRHYARQGESVTALTKAVEMLKRTLPHLQPGAVFGVVLPQGALYDREAEPVRQRLLEEFELSEVSIFADNLFAEADHEVAVVMGRRRQQRTRPTSLWYRRVREPKMDDFKTRLAFSSERKVPQDRFVQSPNHSLLLPDLPEIWDYLSDTPQLGEVVDVQKGFEFRSQSELGERVVVSSRQRRGWTRAVLRASDRYEISELPNQCWIDYSSEVLRRPGAQPGHPQVIVNYSGPREPWRLKAVVDDKGLAVSSRFLVMRSRSDMLSLRILWAVLNSPVANAYAHCFAGKRQTLPREWKEFPLPPLTPERAMAIEAAAKRYLDLVRPSDRFTLDHRDESAVRQALLAMDAEVLRLYDLPPRLERQLLDLFDGVERKGVGCRFRHYYPPDLKAFVPLHELLSSAYGESTLGRYTDERQPIEDPDILAALRHAADSFSEE